MALRGHSVLNAYHPPAIRERLLLQGSRTVKPRYLHGVHGKIIDIDIDNESATICVHRPIGRFHSGHIRCSPLALEKLSGPSGS